MVNLSYANVFFEHESHESDEFFRLRPGIYSWDSGDSWSIIHTLIYFFRTLIGRIFLGCDPVCIRGIREISGQLNTPVILHSICCMALCEPAATELESKNTHGVSDLLRSLLTDLFFDFRLIYILIPV